MSFLKSLFAVSLTGASSVGGTLVYQAAVPGSGKDVLIKEGYYILEKVEYYRGIFEEQKTTIMKDVNDLKSYVADTNQGPSKIKNGCNNELPKTYVRNPKTRKELINLCTYDGIISVRSRLMANNSTTFIMDETEETTKTKQYKIVFAIYRYHDRFHNFFELLNQSDTISKDTTVEQGYSKLKTACETGLKKKHKEVEDVRYFRHISGGCRKFEHETFETLAKKRKEDGETDDKGTNKGSTGKHTEAITQHIKPSNGELKDEDIKNGCETNKSASFEENENYQEKFVVFLSVCGKTTSDQQ